MKKKNNIKFNDGWCFAIVNSRLAEIHFKKGLGIWAHAFVKRSEYTTKREQKMIDTDIKKCVFSYQKGFYYDKIRKIKNKVPDIKKVFPDLKKR
jgi:hypothetical protein